MKKTLLRLWGMPVFLAVLSLFGLIFALVSRESGDWLACLTLAIPIIVALQKYYRRA